MSIWTAIRGDDVSQHGDITAKTAPEDRPKFKRLYEARLNERASMVITMRTNMFGDRSANGELTQPNGRWVLFDPQRVADKILDPVLVPIIEARVAEVFALDRDFMGNGPTSFLDEGGHRWTRS